MIVCQAVVNEASCTACQRTYSSSLTTTGQRSDRCTDACAACHNRYRLLDRPAVMPNVNFTNLRCVPARLFLVSPYYNRPVNALHVTVLWIVLHRLVGRTVRWVWFAVGLILCAIIRARNWIRIRIRSRLSVACGLAVIYRQRCGVGSALCLCPSQCGDHRQNDKSSRQ